MIFSRKLYDQLKFIAQVLLPALGTLYVALAGLWSLPAADSVAGTILAVDTFLGVLLHISSLKYDKSDAKFDGALNVVPTATGGKQFDLVLKGDPNKLEDADHILFKVNKGTTVAEKTPGELEWNARH